MSLNVKIIEAVKENPFIYKGNCSMDERSRFWKQLADKLGLSGQFLKTRWYFLTNSYKYALRDKTYFQYANALAFLKPYVPVAVKEEKCNADELTNELQPEFVITDKDIETESDTEEYVFLEVETLEGSVEEGTMEMDATETANDDETISETQVVIEESEPEPETTIKTEETEEETTLEALTNSAATHNTKHVKAEVTIAKAQYNSTAESTDNSTTKSESRPRSKRPNASSDSEHDTADRRNERCEDIIFGELIVAMLKRMPEEKKRSIKKEIMNLLFT